MVEFPGGFGCLNLFLSPAMIVVDGIYVISRTGLEETVGTIALEFVFGFDGQSSAFNPHLSHKRCIKMVAGVLGSLIVDFVQAF